MDKKLKATAYPRVDFDFEELGAISDIVPA